MAILSVLRKRKDIFLKKNAKEAERQRTNCDKVSSCKRLIDNVTYLNAKKIRTHAHTQTNTTQSYICLHTYKLEERTQKTHQQKIHTHTNLIKYQYASNSSLQFVDGVTRLKWRQNLSTLYELATHREKEREVERRDQSTVANTHSLSTSSILCIIIMSASVSDHIIQRFFLLLRCFSYVFLSLRMCVCVSRVHSRSRSVFCHFF